MARARARARRGEKGKGEREGRTSAYRSVTYGSGRRMSTVKVRRMGGIYGST